MLHPRCAPAIRRSPGEAGKEFLGIGDVEVVKEKFGRAVVGEPALVQNEHAVIQVEVPETVGHRQNDALVVPGNVPHQLDDLVLGLRIEPARDLVAEHQRRRADHLERE